MAEDQYLKDVELPPKRGRIFDRNGAELAASAEVDSVHVNSRLIASADKVDETARALAPALHLERRELEKKLRSRRYFTWLKRRITPEEAQRGARARARRGSSSTRSRDATTRTARWRGRSSGGRGSTPSGRRGSSSPTTSGCAGQQARCRGCRDALGRAVLVGGLGDVGEVAGHDLYTTIDRYIQFRLEQALQNGVADHHAKAGVAVAIDPQ